MATTVDSLLVAFDNQVSAGAQAAAASLDKFTAASTTAANASTTTNTTITQTTKSLTGLVNAIDPAAAAQTKIAKAASDHAKGMVTLNAALAEGKLSASQYAAQMANLDAAQEQTVASAERVRDRQIAVRESADAASSGSATLAKAQSNLASAHGSSASMIANTRIQLVQFTSQIATGQPLLLAAIEQGHQLYDSAAASGQGLKGLASALGGMVTAINPYVLAVGLTVAAGVALGYNAEKQQSQLTELQQALRLTRTDYLNLGTTVQQVGRDVAASSTLSTSDATAAAKAIASAPAFNGAKQQLSDLTRLSGDVAKVFGTSVPEAANLLAQALKNPTAAAKQLVDQGLTTMDAATERTVERLQAQGRAADAAGLVISAYRNATAGATTAVTPLSTAIDGLTQAFTHSGTDGKSFAQVLGETLTQAAAAGVNAITSVVNAMASARDAMNKLRTESQAAAAAAPPLGGIQGSNAATTPDATGRPVLANPNSSAIGIFQVTKPAQQAVTNAYGYMGDPTSLDGNIATGMAYLKLVGSAGAYNQGPAGALAHPQEAAAYTTAVSSQNPAKLPADVAGQIEYWGQILGMPADMIDLGKRIALQESGGRQYAGASNSPAGQSATTVATGGGGANAVVSPDRVSDQISSRQDTLLINQATSASGGTIYTQYQDAADKVQLFTSALAALARQGITTGSQVDQLNAALAKAKGDLNDTLTPAEQYVRSLQDQAAASAGLYDGDNKLIAVRQRLDELNRSLPGSVTPELQAKAESAALADQSNAYRKLVADSSLTVQSQDAISKAYGDGYGAVIQVTAQTSAYQQALKLFPQNSEAARVAQAGLTDANLKSARSLADLQVAQQNAQSRDSLAYIQAETDSLGMNEVQREKLLATMRAEQQMHERFGNDLPQEAKDYITLAGRISDATASYQQQQAALQELSGFTTQTFDTVSQAITSAFATGSLKAVDFGSIVKSVMASVISEVAKLAILNPILNSLFGQNNVTLSSVGGAIGGLLGNGSSGGSGSGLIGGLASLLGGASSDSSNLSGAAGPVGSGIASTGLDFGTAAGAAGSSTGAATAGGVLGTGLSPSSIVAGAGVLSALASLTSSTADTSSKVMAVAKLGVSTLASSSIGTSIANSVVNALGNAAGTSQVASSLAYSAYGVNAAGQAIPAVLTSGQLAGANAAVLSSSVGASSAATDAAVTAASQGAAVSAEAATTAATAVSNAVPLLGVAVSIVSDLVQGNYRGAGLVAGGAALGAAIGSAFFGVGAAVGAAVGAVIGGLVDTFFPQHAKNAYASTEVDVQDGHLAVGQSVAQLMSTGEAEASVETFSQNFNHFLDNLNLTITNANGVVASVGQGIKGLTQITSFDQLIPSLRFGSTDTTSNFGIAAEGALGNKQFGSIDEFTGYLQQIANFADRMTGLGIQIAAVGTDFKNIQVASVGGSGDLSTALEHDLPGQTFANEQALDDEVNKVNQFVNGTLPSLLNPVIQKTVGTVQQGVQKIYEQYQSAEQQAQAYGLSITDLAHAADEAVQLYIQPAIESLNQSTSSIVARGLAATGDQEDADLINYDVKAQQERESYSASILDVYGDAYKTSQGYATLMNQLETVQGEERAAIVKKYADAATTSVTEAAQAQATAISAAQSSVTSNIVSLADYARGLRTSDLSPLSAQDQATQSAAEFQAQAQLAAGGDSKALAGLSGYADTALKADRAVYGNGDQYTQFFDSVLASLGTAANSANSDALTNSAYLQGQATTSSTIVTAIQSLQDEVAGLRAEVKQGSAKPLRVAA